MRGEATDQQKKGQWVVKSTTKIFENPFFAVFEDDVIKPTGDAGKYATIRFNKGASTLAIDEEENVYLTRQFRYAIGRYDLEIATGSIEGEGPLEAAQRELKEELGIIADEWIDAGTVHSLTSITQCESRLFVARGLSFTKQETEGTEDIELIKLKLDEAHDMVMRGEITDADTCILILKALLMKEKWQ